MRRTRSTLALVLGTALLAVACGADPDGTPPTDDPDAVVEPDAPGDTDSALPGDTDSALPGDTDSALPGDEDTTDPDEASDVATDLDDELLARAARTALADAESRTGGAATLVSAERVTWSDGSLGCPQPDQMYTQALVDGVRVVVEAGGETLHYHGSLDGDPVLCERPEPPTGR